MRKQIEVIENIIGKWLKISLGIYLFIWISMKITYYFCKKASIYADYYRNLIGSMFELLVILIFIFGFLCNELLYYIHNKNKRKVIQISLVIVIFILGGCVSLKHTSFYSYYSDLHYALNDDYSEEVQELKDIYLEEISGSKLNTKTIYIETNDFKFEPSEYTVEVKDFAKFKNKFKNCKKVKIKYLPNSNELLWIEPVKS